MLEPKKLKYPINTKLIRFGLVNDFDICPECGGDFDTGWECNDCNFDAIQEVGNIGENGQICYSNIATQPN